MRRSSTVGTYGGWSTHHYRHLGGRGGERGREGVANRQDRGIMFRVCYVYFMQ